MSRPLIVVNTFGEPGSGGPITMTHRLLSSRLQDSYRFEVLHQPQALGGIRTDLIRDWADRLAELRPDLVRISGLGNEGFHAAAAARLAGVARRLVVVHGTARDLQTAGLLRRSRPMVVSRVLEPATLRTATHVVTVSERASRRGFIRHCGAHHLPAVPNGVDLPEPTTSRAQLRQGFGWGDEFVIVYAGRLTFQKGLGDLAAAGWKDPHVRLVLLGGGLESDLIRQSFVGAPWRVQFAGQRLDVADFLAAADAFVLPSWHENMPNALLEAMAHGLPCVATAVGGNREVLSGAGVLVPPHSPDALRSALQTVVAGRYPGMGSSGRRRIAQRYTLDRCVDGWDATFSKVLEWSP